MATLQDQADILEGLERDLHTKQQADAVASSNYDESVKEIKSQNKKLKELKKNMSDVGCGSVETLHCMEDYLYTYCDALDICLVTHIICRQTVKAAAQAPYCVIALLK